MSPELITAIAAAVVAIINAIFGSHKTRKLKKKVDEHGEMLAWLKGRNSQKVG